MNPSVRLESAVQAATTLRKRLREDRSAAAKAEKLLSRIPESAAECIASEKNLNKLLAIARSSQHQALAACAEELAAALKEAGAAAREGFMRDVRDAARAQSLPAEYRDSYFVIAGLKLDPDLGAGRCRVFLGKELVVDNLPLDSARCLDAVKRESARLLGNRGEPSKLLRSLFDAYRASCGVRNLGSGEMAPIIDVLAQMALMRQPTSFRRNPARANFQDYGRAEFAADLFYLKREQRLEHSGSRLTLQTAVIDTADDPARSISLPDNEGRSQVFYQGLAFVRERGGRS